MQPDTKTALQSSNVVGPVGLHLLTTISVTSSTDWWGVPPALLTSQFSYAFCAAHRPTVPNVHPSSCSCHPHVVSAPHSGQHKHCAGPALPHQRHAYARSPTAT